MAKQLRNGDVSAGRVGGIGPTHAVVWWDGQRWWETLCNGGHDLHGPNATVSSKFLTPDKPVTCAGCKRTYRLLKQLMEAK